MEKSTQGNTRTGEGLPFMTKKSLEFRTYSGAYIPKCEIYIPIPIPNMDINHPIFGELKDYCLRVFKEEKLKEEDIKIMPFSEIKGDRILFPSDEHLGMEGFVIWKDSTPKQYLSVN